MLGDCAQRYLGIERLAAHWQRVPPIPVLAADYEAIVADPEGEGRRVIEFLGLEWEAGCLDFHRIERLAASASVWQVRQPVFTRSVARWWNYARHPAAADCCGGRRCRRPRRNV